MAELSDTRGARVLLCAALCLAGCDCGGDRAVPFKRPEPAATALEAQAPEPTAEKPDAGSLRSGDRHLAAPSRIELEHGTIDRGEGQIHASLALDNEGRHVLLLVVDGDQNLRLEQSDWIDGAYTSPKAVRILPPVPNKEPRACEVLSAGLDALSAAHLLASAKLSCTPMPAVPAPDAQGKPAGADTEPAGVQSGSSATNVAVALETGSIETSPPPSIEHLHWVLSGERTPRVLEQLHLTPASDSEASGLGVRFSGVQLDEDGHPDLRATLQLADSSHLTDTDARDEEPVVIVLEWLNRPSGLARRDSEPEATLLAGAEHARNLVKRSAERAEQAATRVLDLHRRLCREGQPTELWLSGQPGIPCGPSLGAGRAQVVLVMAHAKLGNPLAAVERFEALNSPALRLLPLDRKRAQAAIDGIPRRTGYRFVRGPILASVGAPPEHRPRVAFLDENRLLLRGSPNETYDLDSGQRAPVGIDSPLPWTSPDAHWTLIELYRDCDGFHALLVPSDQVVGAVVGRAGAKTPLVLPAAAPANHACPLTGAARRDTGGLTVLDYTEQGLLLAQGRALLQLALSPTAEGQGPARPLSAGASLPHGRHATTVARNHSTYALPSPAGIAVFGPHGVELLDASDIPGSIDTVSLSPSGERLAVVQGRQVWVGQRRPATVPAASEVAQPGGPPPASETPPAP